jgi:hypothetical protein
MKKNRIIFGIKLAVVSVVILSSVGCNNSLKTKDTNSLNSKDLALVSSNLERTTNKKTPDLYYGVGTRFAAVTKVNVHNATTIYDFLNGGEKEQIEHINAVKITIVKDNQLSHIQAYSKDDQLTDAQLKILKSTDYFSHFTVRTEFKGRNKDTGKLEERFFGPHITVVPEKQATYVDGNEALINYLKDNSKESMNAIIGDKLGAIKLSFIVSKEGIITNVKHDAMTTGYASIDEKLMELIKNIPGEWTPAENSKGEKMDYEFVFTFGPRDGC